MSDFRYPPPGDEFAFEDFCLLLLRDLWNLPTLQQFGRRGERQFGIDLLDPVSPPPRRAVQCKHRGLASTLRMTEVDEEVRRLLEFPHRVDDYYILTSARRSGALQLHLQRLNESHAAASLPRIHLWSWDDIELLIDSSNVGRQYFNLGPLIRPSQSSDASPAPPIQEIDARDVAQLLDAIGSHRTITLAPGRYDLSSIPDRYRRHVRWTPDHDGRSVVLRDVENMTLRGSGQGITELVASPQYTYVLSLEQCRGVVLCDMTLGHVPPGTCSGGVLHVDHSDDIRVRDLDLFGCGTEGLTLAHVSTFRMDRCCVRDCSYGIATLSDCRDVSFERSVFRDNGDYWGFQIRDSSYVDFTDCAILRNVVGASVFTIERAFPVKVTRGAMVNNTCRDVGPVELVDVDVRHRSVSVGS